MRVNCAIDDSTDADADADAAAENEVPYIPPETVPIKRTKSYLEVHLEDLVVPPTYVLFRVLCLFRSPKTPTKELKPPKKAIHVDRRHLLFLVPDLDLFLATTS